jgi:hypothetical protein
VCGVGSVSDAICVQQLNVLGVPSADPLISQAFACNSLGSFDGDDSIGPSLIDASTSRPYWVFSGVNVQDCLSITSREIERTLKEGLVLWMQSEDCLHTMHHI